MSERSENRDSRLGQPRSGSSTQGREPPILLGESGTGKSHLAIGLGIASWLVGPINLENGEMLLGRSGNGRQGDRSVEGYEPASVLYRQGQQIDVGYLTWPVDPVPVDPG